MTINEYNRLMRFKENKATTEDKQNKPVVFDIEKKFNENSAKMFSMFLQELNKGLKNE